MKQDQVPDVQLLVNIDVEDLPRALEFYTGALGLRTGRRFGDDAVELIGGSSPIYLLRKAANTPAVPGGMPRRRYERHWTPVHLDFVVADIRAVVQRVLAMGGKLENPVQTNTWGHLALMCDPFGNGFCLIEFLGKGYDEIAGHS